ncbi:MAG: uroporphyrinogen-III synthase [Hyphomicrobiaceae bacterium]
MHILVTRPEPDASQMRAQIEAMGHSADVAPLLVITVDAPSDAALQGRDGLVVTSRNGLRALERASDLRALLGRPLFVVGRGTAAAARALGFKDVIIGPATAKDLVPLIVDRMKGAHGTRGIAPREVNLLHLSGDKISFDLVPPLAEHGLRLDRATVYRSQPADRLLPEVQGALSRGRYDGVVLMSPLTAETFVHLVEREGLADAAAHPAYLCLSAGIAERVDGLKPGRVLVAPKPTAEDMLALVGQLAALSE